MAWVTMAVLDLPARSRRTARRRRLRQSGRVAARIAVPAALLAPHLLDRVPLLGALLAQLAPGVRYLLVPVLLAETLVLWTVDGRPLDAAAAAWVRWRLAPTRVVALRRVRVPRR
jgi:hypothetical protein